MLFRSVENQLREKGLPVFQISAASREGIQELLYAMAKLVQQERAGAVAEERTRIVLRPPAVDDSGFTVVKNSDDSFSVNGAKVVRWVRQTNFKNAEAVGYLADRLAQLGVEKELFKKGAVAGSEVRIGDGDDAVVFDWEPTIEAGAELLSGPRGDDMRIPREWERLEEESIDQLSEDEIDRQWEYNVADPTTPRLSDGDIGDRKSTRLNSSHSQQSRMPSSA